MGFVAVAGRDWREFDPGRGRVARVCTDYAELPPGDPDDPAAANEVSVRRLIITVIRADTNPGQQAKRGVQRR